MTGAVAYDRGSAIRLVHEFDYRATLKPPLDLGRSPYRWRAFFEIAGGQMTGERLSGEVLPGGGDWLVLSDDGYGRLDVRSQLKTDDGALIHLSHGGVLELNEAVMLAQAEGVETGFGDQYFRIDPCLETADPRYGWVNQTLFVAEGRVTGDGVAYCVYRIE